MCMVKDAKRLDEGLDLAGTFGLLSRTEIDEMTDLIATGAKTEREALAHLEHVKALTANCLHARCGEFEDIATAMDNAIRNIKTQQEDNQKELIKKVDDVKKDIMGELRAIKGSPPTVKATLIKPRQC